MAKFFDLTGMMVGKIKIARFAYSKLVGGQKRTFWVCLCNKCGSESTQKTEDIKKLRGIGCAVCLYKTYAAKVSWAERGWCSWCLPERRKAGNTLHECKACERTAQRNGRSPDGRPIAKIARPVNDPNSNVFGAKFYNYPPCTVCNALRRQPCHNSGRVRPVHKARLKIWWPEWVKNQTSLNLESNNEAGETVSLATSGL